MRVHTLIIGLTFSIICLPVSAHTIFTESSQASTKECSEVGLNKRLLKICKKYCSMACETKNPNTSQEQCNMFKDKYEYYAKKRGSAVQIPCDIYKSKPYQPYVRVIKNH